MRFLVKPLDFPNAFMYGAGHGGVEAMLLCGVASINNIASAVMINSGTMSAQLATLTQRRRQTRQRLFGAVDDTELDVFCRRRRADHCGGAPSEPVDSGVPVHPQKAPMELVRAYLFHFVIDSLSVLLSAVASVWVVELVTALVTGGAVLMARYACMEE